MTTNPSLWGVKFTKCTIKLHLTLPRVSRKPRLESGTQTTHPSAQSLKFRSRNPRTKGRPIFQATPKTLLPNNHAKLHTPNPTSPATGTLKVCRRLLFHPNKTGEGRYSSHYCRAKRHRQRLRVRVSPIEEWRVARLKRKILCRWCTCPLMSKAGEKRGYRARWSKSILRLEMTNDFTEDIIL